MSMYTKHVIAVKIAFVVEHLEADELEFITFFTGPGMYRKVEKKGRRNSGKCTGRKSATVNSYVNNNI